MAIARRVVRGLGAVVVSDLLRVVSMGVLVLLLTRVLLTPTEYGLLFLALSILSVAALFARLGLDKSAARYVTEYRERDPAQVPHILRTALGYNVVAIVAVSALLVAFSGHIANALDEPALAGLLAVGVGYVAAQTLSSLCVTTFQGLNRVRWSAVLRGVSSVGKPLFVVAFVGLGLGVVGVLLGYVAALLVAALVGLAVLYRDVYREHDGGEMEEGLTRRLLEYSVPLTATRGANVLDKRVDIIMVGYFLDPLAVAYYNLAKQISDFAITPAGSIGFTISPAYGEFKANEKLQEAGRVYETSFTYTLALYLPATAGLALVAGPAVRFVFGEEYLGAVPVVQLFSLYVLLIAVDKITNDGLDFLGRARARAVAKGGASVANFVLNLLLIPVVGVMGAAAATVATTTLLVAVELVVVYRELPIRGARLAKRLGIVAAVTAGMALPVRVLVPYVSGVASLLGVVLLGVGVWGALVTASGLVDVARLRALV